MAMSMAIAFAPVRPLTSNLSYRVSLPATYSTGYQQHYRGYYRGNTSTSVKYRARAGGENSNKVDGNDEATEVQVDGWDVPWGYGVTMFGLAAWLVSFLSTGYTTAIIADKLGFGRKELPDLDEQATYVLISQILQTIVGIGAINAAIYKYRPLPSGLFVYDLRDPFSLERGWLLWAVIGLLSAGGAVVITSTVISFLVGDPPREQDALSQLLPLIGVTPFSTVSLIVVTGVLAPLLEETVFRGFLLASLAKKLPEPIAVLVSAAVFSLAHLTPGEFPQLFALGTVIGFSYTRTRNLLTPIFIHAVWNSGVVLVLTFLRLEGYDLRDMLSS